MENYIIIAVVAIIIVLAARYIYKAKKNGQKCIGCPDSRACGGNCSACAGECSCNSTKENE